MATNRKSGQIRYRYGICLNKNCSKCESKEVQQISAHKPLVCEECSKPLHECPPPTSAWDKYKKFVFIGGGLAVVAIIVIVIMMISGGNKEVKVKPIAEVQEATTEKPKQEQTKEEGDDVMVESDTFDIGAINDEMPEENGTKVSATPNLKDGKTARTTTNVGKTTSKKTTTTSGTTKKRTGRYQGTISLAYGTYSGDILNGKADGAGTLKYSKRTKVVSTKDAYAEKGEYIKGTFENGKPTFVTLYKNDGNVVSISR